MGLSFTSFYISIPSDFLWGILALILGLFLIIASILHYHWRYYGIKNNKKTFPKILFWIVSILLILIMTFALVSYESNL